MLVRKGRTNQPSFPQSHNFTGEVWGDRVISDDDEFIVVNDIFFAPRARTFWHSHASGQLLIVISGRGIIADRNGGTALIEAGDVAWSGSHEVHWHGSGPDTFMHHRSAKLGDTIWHGEVTDAEYRDAAASLGLPAVTSSLPGK
jgi:quercetin dioxygenase-like cupin family protein